MKRRPHILFAWELGSNFGHVAKIAPIIRAIGDRAEITFAARDTGMVRRFAPDLAATIIDAPHAPTNRRSTTPAISFSDNLRHVGYDRSDHLRELLERWVKLLSTVRPDILVAQAAPTALIAARTFPVQTVVYGGGFDLPPRSAPMPPFIHWAAADTKELERREAAVLETANAALGANGLPSLGCVSDIMDTDLRLLATVPELDHYGARDRWERGTPEYLGHVYSIDTGAELAWRPGTSRRIFAYLRAESQNSRSMIAALARGSATHDVILAAPGLDPKIAAALRRSRVRWIDGPVRLDRLLPDANLAISHGSSGATAAFFFGGVPHIGLPNHTEQVMQIRAASRAGTALGLMGNAKVEDCQALIDRALSSPQLRQNAKRAARRHAGLSAHAVRRKLAEKVLSLL